MKLPTKATFAIAAALTLTGCTTTQENQLIGAVVGGIAGGELSGGGDAGTAAGAILGYVAGGAIDRAIGGGCRYSSNPVAGHINFISLKDRIYLVCPPARPGNKTIEELRANPEWELITIKPQRRTYGYTLGGGNGFR